MTKLDLTKPLQTRSGHKVRIICTDSNHPFYPIVALVTYDNGSEICHTYTGDGYYYADRKKNSFDLINISEEKPKFDPTKPVRTRDGRKARIICTDHDRGKTAYPIIALIEDCIYEKISSHKINGSSVWPGSGSDLINA